MGKLTVEEVIDRIDRAGIRCARGYPGERMPAIRKPAVAVNLHREDDSSRTLAVHVLSPAVGGASVCEELAARVAGLLRENGGVCIQEDCCHDGRADRFSVRLLATWEEDPPLCPYSVHLGGWKLLYVKKFSAHQEVSLEPVGAMGENEEKGLLRKEGPWYFTLEEQFPPDSEEPEGAAEPFTLVLRRGILGEIYENCRWVSCLREDTAGGLRQIREGRAGERSVVVYE